MKKCMFFAVMAIVGLVACAPAQKQETTMSGLNPANFESLFGGKETHLYTLTNKNGVEVCITNFGARIVSVMVPDKEGNFVDVVLGFDKVSDYETIPSDFGATIGRYANRINQGKITVDGVEYQLPRNSSGVHCLHGGSTLKPAPLGWQYAVFDTDAVTPNSITLSYLSPDMEANFPGTVNLKVTFTLTDANEIDINYEATTDKKTVINLTNHSYFNLNADASPIVDNILAINADSFTPVDDTFMTSGEIRPVDGTVMDFRQGRVISEVVEADDEQIHNGNGIDHNWVLNAKRDINVPAAMVWSKNTGITLTVFTDEPGLQVYTGNFLNGTITGKGGKLYEQRSAICLESQKFPDSPNKGDLEGWYSAELNPGETYHSRCKFVFGTRCCEDHETCQHCEHHNK